VGQQEVYDFLKDKYKKNKEKWWTSKIIAEKTDISRGSVTMSLKKLCYQNFIEFKVECGYKKGNQYKHKPDSK